MRYLLDRKTKRYIDALDSLVQSYQNTYHRTIGMSPIRVTDENADVVRARMYPDMTPRKAAAPKFSVGDYVRISMQRPEVGYKGYDVQWSFQTYQIHTILRYRQHIQYRLKDYKGRILEGVSFFVSFLHNYVP